jgi:hypothetical protein
MDCVTGGAAPTRLKFTTPGVFTVSLTITDGADPIIVAPPVGVTTLPEATNGAFAAIVTAPVTGKKSMFLNTSTGNPTTLRLPTAGVIRISVLTSGATPAITAAPTCAVDVTGGIKTSRVTVTTPATTDGNVFSGSYTPAQVSTNTNVASVTFGASYYMRVGDMVTVIGSVSITATASATDTILLMSLPIASNFSSSRNLSGTGASTSTGVYGSVPAAILGDTTDDCAQFRLRPTSTSAVAYQYSFTYLVA